MVHVYSQSQSSMRDAGIVMDIRMSDGQVVDTKGNFDPKVLDSITSHYDGTWGDCMDMRYGCIDLNDFKPWWKDHWDNRKPCTIELFFSAISGSFNSVLFGCVSGSSSQNCPGCLLWAGGDSRTRTISTNNWNSQTIQIYGHSASQWNYAIYVIEGEYSMTLRGAPYINGYDFDSRNNVVKIEGQIANDSPLRVGGRTHEFNSATRPDGIRWPAYLHHVRAYDYAITKVRE